jgi:hypothetical protein
MFEAAARFIASLLGWRRVEKLDEPKPNDPIRSRAAGSQGVGSASEPKIEVSELVRVDPQLLERSLTQWQFGDWESLTALTPSTLDHHPDRAKLALLAAAGHYQAGDAIQARQFSTLAQQWGVDRKLLARVLISGVHHSLGKAAAVVGNSAVARQHLEAAVRVGSPGADVRLLSEARATRLGSAGAALLVQANAQAAVPEHGTEQKSEPATSTPAETAGLGSTLENIPGMSSVVPDRWGAA